MKNKDKYNAYMRNYMLGRYHRRRCEAIRQLGGKCVVCGAESDLELDHKDSRTKSFDISKGHSRADYFEELKKCQVLCKTCHKQKSIVDCGNAAAKGTHGTLSAYRYCKCDLCKAAKSAHSRKYREKKLARLESDTFRG